MKTLGFLAATCLVLGLSGSASAESFTSVNDPSGAPMCFDAQGQKATLASCQSEVVESYVTRNDPTGVAMCFESNGDKAPLSKCEGLLTASILPTQKASVGSFVAMLSFFR